MADGNESAFAYKDTASTRAHIGVPTGRLKSRRIAIVGLGGTGAYVLDLVARTPVAKIDLWDGDVLQQHNVFRYPGAAPIETLQATPTKVGYLAGVYQAMRRHIVPHAEMITADNAHLLRDFDYVFACVDRADARRLRAARTLQH
ncbi:ThiF family adenylyltransferase [Dyella japonica]|uniref:ThiF family adenylyltransferase n=1 Tax=Dyella japonica TaxID=231455 RepID=UPI00296252A8|nr:ThiF family adenylyltransferase [Dyella japonica]